MNIKFIDQLLFKHRSEAQFNNTVITRIFFQKERKAIRTLIFPLLMFTLFAEAEVRETMEDEWGILNPSDGDRDLLRRKLDMGQLDSITCSLGFNTSKYDNIELARRFATRCAEAGIIKAMIWISYLEMNGIGGPINAKAATEWDRRAADAGSPVGMYNYGLDLLRGFGVKQNDSLGRRYIDKAADFGLEIAQMLKAADYELDAVIYDAEVVQ